MRTRFDDQAETYDDRAGFPPNAARTIADAILAMVPKGPGWIVEIGGGTGLLGRHLAAPGRFYVGVDFSAAMLGRFASRTPAPLVRFDCAATWPLRDAIASAVVASRVVHLIDPTHLTGEVLRVGQPGAVVVIGRIERDPDGLKSRLRRQRRILLQRAGLAEPDGRRRTEDFIQRLVEAGGIRLPRQTVADWRGTTSPRQLISAWEGVAPPGRPPISKQALMAVLEALRASAEAEPGGLDREHRFSEGYVLDAVRLP